MTEESNDATEILNLLRTFIEGDESSGNILLQLSGAQNLGLLEEERKVVIQVLNLIIEELSEGKICELAIGIVGFYYFVIVGYYYFIVGYFSIIIEIN